MKKLIVLILIAGAVVGIYHLTKNKGEIPTPVEETPVVTPVTITEVAINEPNYTGKKVTITGSGAAADAARDYVATTIASFAKDADVQVPKLREEFGSGPGPSNYTIDIQGSYVAGEKINTIILQQYIYTGGANGMSSYKVFNESKNGTLLSIESIIKADQQAAFVNLVKKELLAKGPKGTGEIAIFEDVIPALKLEDFADWTIENENFVIYFDKYAIGPGAMGAFPFSIPLSKIEPFLQK